MPGPNLGMSLTRRFILALALMAGLTPVFAQAPPPVPALPDAERRTTYSISGSTCACAVNFAIYGDSTDVQNWLEVFVNGALVTSANWTITSPTGPLSTIPRPITDAVLTFNAAQTGTVQIVGARRPRRTSQFAENQGVPARNLNQVFTDVIAMLRENWDKTNDVTGRAVLAPPGETLNLLPIAANRSSHGACFDSGGNLTSCVSIPSSTFAAGNGITFTGVGPTTIKVNLAAGSNVTLSGTNPITINVPLAAGSGIALTGSNPLTISTVPSAQSPQLGVIPTTSPITVTIASPAVFTWANHGLLANSTVYFCTTGALPTGLTACNSNASGLINDPTLCYVVGSSITLNTFQCATSIANANAGTSINTTGAQSGTHTAFANYFACAGCIGEYKFHLTLTNNANVTTAVNTIYNSLSLSAGVWEVGGTTGIVGTGGATVCADTHASYGIGISSIATAPFGGSLGYHITSNNSNCMLFTLDSSQIVVPSPGPSTINFVGLPDFSGGTATLYGVAHAKRMYRRRYRVRCRSRASCHGSARMEASRHDHQFPEVCRCLETPLAEQRRHNQRIGRRHHRRSPDRVSEIRLG